jgi:hypothetical protein
MQGINKWAGFKCNDPPVALRCAQNSSMRAMSGFRARHVAVRHALLHAPIFRVRSFALLKANLLTRFLLRKGGALHLSACDPKRTLTQQPSRNFSRRQVAGCLRGACRDRALCAPTAAHASLSSVFRLGCSTKDIRLTSATIDVPQLGCRRRLYEGPRSP